VRGLDVIHGDAKEVLSGSKFDVVLSIETIEHMNDLDAYLKTIQSLLVHDGLLLITTPRNDCWACLLFGEQADSYMAPNHINFFDDSNLTLLLKRYGFHVNGVQRFRARMGVGLFYKRLTKVREYVTYAPPLHGPAVVFMPKGYKGDRRQHILGHAPLDLYDSQTMNTNSSTKVDDMATLSLPRQVLRRLANVLTLSFPVHMLVTAVNGN